MPIIWLNLCLLFLSAVAEKCIEEPKYQYIFFNEKTTFLDAYIRCKQQGLDPVEIITKKDEEELEAVLPNIPEGWQYGYWLFATNLGTKPTYYWLNSGSPIVFSNYGIGEPNDVFGIENCLVIIKVGGGKFKWNDTPCDLKNKFICRSPSRSQTEESFQKQLQLRDEQWLKNSSQLIHEAHSKNLEKFNELAATMEATKRRIEEMNEEVHSQSDSKEWFQKQLQLQDEQWLNKSNQLIQEANAKNLQKINELNATMEATKRENEELKEAVHRQCPNSGDIGDIQILQI